MNFFKKIVLFLLVLPLFFGISSFVFTLNTHAATCDKNPPKLEVSPVNRNGQRGDEKLYDVKVTNVDTGTCPVVDFTLSKNLPGDTNTAWTGHFDDNTLSIGKGVSKTTTLHVKSPSSATLGEKTIWVKVTRPNGQETAKRITYTVIPESCRNKPDFLVTPDSRTANPGKTVAYTIVIKNKDGEPCAARHFSLEAKMPNSNWRALFAKETFDLEVGGQATLNVGITSPETATPGDKKITLNLKNASNEIANTKDVTYVIPDPSAANCGGIAGLTCPAGYTCQYQNTPPNPDEQGICVIPSPRVTTTPTLTPTPTTFPGNGLLDVVIGIDGIGSTARIPTRKDENGNDLGGNTNPLNKNRNLTLSLYSAATNTLTEGWNAWTFTYNPTSQKFENELALSNDFPTGIYNVYIEGPGLLRAQLPGSLTITKSQTTNIKSNNFYMITGNINNTDQSEESVDLLDYNVLISCSIYSQDFSTCEQNQNYSTYSDLNNDGRIDEDDFTLFLKEYGSHGVILPE